MTPEAAAAAKLVVESPAGFGAWFETFGVIRGKEKRYDPETQTESYFFTPRLNHLQQQIADIVEYCSEHHKPCRMIVLKPRQKGSSTSTVGVLYHFTRWQGSKGVIIGKEKKQADNLWGILQTYHQYDSYPWEKGGIINTEYAAYDNAGTLEKLTGKNQDAGRSGTYQAAIITELGRWEVGAGEKSSPEAVLQGVLNCVPPTPGSVVIMESTARGNSGVFYKTWRSAVSFEDFKNDNYDKLSGTPWIRVFSPAFAFEDSRLELSPEQKDALRNDLTDEEHERMGRYHVPLEYIAWRRYALEKECRGNETLLKHDFPDSPEEAFHASAQSVFSTVAIRAMRDKWRGKSPRWGVLKATSDDPWEREQPFSLEDRELAHSEVFIWETPQYGQRYILAVDTMTGVAKDEDGRKRDHHCAMVLRDGYFDVERGIWYPPKVVARTRAPSKDPEWNCQWRIDDLAEVVWGLHRFYGNCLIAPEANKDGGLIMLLHQKGAPLYVRDKQTDRGGEIADTEWTGKFGFLTVGGKGENTRTWILNQLEAALYRYAVEGDGIEIPDERTLDEMEVFVENLKGRGEAAPGEHDDSVMCLAIAYNLRSQGTVMKLPTVNKQKPSDIVLTELAGRRRTNAANC